MIHDTKWDDRQSKKSAGSFHRSHQASIHSYWVLVVVANTANDKQIYLLPAQDVWLHLPFLWSLLDWHQSQGICMPYLELLSLCFHSTATSTMHNKMVLKLMIHYGGPISQSINTTTLRGIMKHHHNMIRNSTLINMGRRLRSKTCGLTENLNLWPNKSVQ